MGCSVLFVLLCNRGEGKTGDFNAVRTVLRGVVIVDPKVRPGRRRADTPMNTVRLKTGLYFGFKALITQCECSWASVPVLRDLIEGSENQRHSGGDWQASCQEKVPNLPRRPQITLYSLRDCLLANFWQDRKDCHGCREVGILDLKREDIYRCSRILAQLKITFQGTLPSQKQNKTKPIRSQGRTSVELDSI